MKRVGVIAALLSMGLLFSFIPPSFSQEDKSPDRCAYDNPEAVKFTGTSTYDIELKLKFKTTIIGGRVTKLDARVMVLKDIPPIQEVISFVTVPAYSEIKIDEDGNHVAFFDIEGFDTEKELTFRYRVKVTGFKVIKKPVEGPLPNAFIEPERYVESDDPRIKEVSDSLCSGKNTTWDKTRAIYDFVTEHMTYKHSYNDLGALCALATGTGDCTDYTYLMIALCRAQKIPARFINSFIYKKNPKRSVSDANLHNWLEVYMPEIGWVPMDPVEGRHDNDGCFAVKKDTTVIWHYTRVSDLMGGRGHYWYRYSFDGNDPHLEAEISSVKVIKVKEE